MRRLSYATAESLPTVVDRPRYDPRAAAIGVVHLGTGAFHRAHQAMFFERALYSGDPRWAVLGASLRSAAVRDQLVPQDGLYTLSIRDGDDTRTRLIGAIRDVLVAPENPARLVAAMAEPTVHIVTLTITEKGYKLDPVTGALIEEDADLAHDLAMLDRPRTAPGLIVAALARRRSAGLMPFTAVSCDNLPHNGARLAAAVLKLAAAHDPGLADWIAAHGAFPATMVDRIVPATEPADIIEFDRLFGIEDRAMVKTEPFVQWVIEDRFAGERPDLEAAGAKLTGDVSRWEEAKLRLLNGAHSAIAYLGGLAGITHVDAVVALPAGCRFVEALWDEAETTLVAPPELDIAQYRAELMKRFANPALAHSTRQIAMDGSQKLPQRLLAPIMERLASGKSIDALALAVAAWMRWQEGRDDTGNAFTVDDPLAAQTSAARGRPTEDYIDLLLGIQAIFPRELAAHPTLRRVLKGHLTRLRNDGALATLEQGYG